MDFRIRFRDVETWTEFVGNAPHVVRRHEMRGPLEHDREDKLPAMWYVIVNLDCVARHDGAGAIVYVACLLEAWWRCGERDELGMWEAWEVVQPSGWEGSDSREELIVTFGLVVWKHGVCGAECCVSSLW